MNGVGDDGGVPEVDLEIVGAVREAWVEAEVEGVGPSSWLTASDGELSLPRVSEYEVMLNVAYSGMGVYDTCVLVDITREYREGIVGIPLRQTGRIYLEYPERHLLVGEVQVTDDRAAVGGPEGSDEQLGGKEVVSGEFADSKTMKQRTCVPNT
jgi:hypothetical protein